MNRKLGMEGKAAVITGGASGIGAGAATAFLEAGLFVVIGDLEVQRAKAEELIGKHPVGRGVFVPCDVTKREDLEALAAAATAFPCGGASIWFNNAGIGTEGAKGSDLLRDYDDPKWKLQQNINIHAVIEGTQLAYKHMRDAKIQGPKFIVATASMAGLLPQAAPVYAANKAAVIHFTRSIATRFMFAGVDDVKCYALCPTFTETPLFMKPGNSGSIDVIGGMAQVSDIVDALLDCLEKQPPSGSICRITLRSRGKCVVRDLVAYGKEAGGPLPPREGPVLGARTLSKEEHAVSQGGELYKSVSTSTLPQALTGRCAVITGGASGIGAATACSFLEAGLYVVVGDLESQCARAELFLSKYPAGRGIFVPCDVTKKADLEALAQAASSCGGASVWFNNAGITTEGMKEGDEDLFLVPNGRRWRTQQAINLDAVIEGTQVAYKHMRDCKVSGDKFIVATASMAGLLPQASPVYCANKAGVNHFTRAMSTRLAASPDTFNKEVHMYSVCPTFTDTPLWRSTDTKMTRKAVGGVAQVQDIVDAVLDLINQKVPSGSVCRVTLRDKGQQVVRDLVAYGKELGGTLAARDGAILGQRDISDTERDAAIRARL